MVLVWLTVPFCLDVILKVEKTTRLGRQHELVKGWMREQVRLLAPPRQDGFPYPLATFSAPSRIPAPPRGFWYPPVASNTRSLLSVPTPPRLSVRQDLHYSLTMLATPVRLLLHPRDFSSLVAFNTLSQRTELPRGFQYSRKAFSNDPSRLLFSVVALSTLYRSSLPPCGFDYSLPASLLSPFSQYFLMAFSTPSWRALLILVLGIHSSRMAFCRPPRLPLLILVHVSHSHCSHATFRYSLANFISSS